MKISFFEEFPGKENLAKLELVDFPTKLYLAASSLEEFLKIKNKLLKNTRNKKLIKELVYWPILEFKEGYWISPFSSRKALKRVFSELKDKKVSVMLDLELPTTKNPGLYFTQFFNFVFNKNLIKRFVRNYLGKVYLAEYYPEGKRKEKILQFLGLHYVDKRLKVVKMVYHSMHDFKEEFIRKEFERGVEEYGENYVVGVGTIAKGIAGWERILSVEQLGKDLELAKAAGVKEAVVFRLGGLDKGYLEVVKGFV